MIERCSKCGLQPVNCSCRRSGSREQNLRHKIRILKQAVREANRKLANRLLTNNYSWPKIPDHLKDPLVYVDAMLGITLAATTMNRRGLYVVHGNEWLFFREVREEDELQKVHKLNTRQP